MKQFILASLLILTLSQSTWAYDRPFVEEDVDEIIVMTVDGNHYDRLIFLRNDKVLATRLLGDEMIFTIVDDKFSLSWNDRGVDRVVNTKILTTMRCAEDPTMAGRTGPWWNMFRNMRDLKQP